MWQAVDANRHGGELVTPDPVAYLRGFDASPAVAPYKAALLKACQLQHGDAVLNVGCGLGSQTLPLVNAVTAVSSVAADHPYTPSAPRPAPTLDHTGGGGNGHVLGVDISADAVAASKKRAAADGVAVSDATFEVADAYSLPYPANTFDVVLEDRVLQHMTRPLEAVQEMLRVTAAGGRIVVGNPDWRSFQLDVPSAGVAQRFRGTAEAGRRWGEARRPPAELDYDFGELTTRLLNGVIPKLTAHSYLGLAQPRLLRAAGCTEVELTVVPVQLKGRKAIEAVAPITYFAKLSSNNGGITDAEAASWLERLVWEEHGGSDGGGSGSDSSGGEQMLGTLLFYVCTGKKPAHHTTPASVVQLTPELCTAHSSSSADIAKEVTELVNATYNVSDTGITLSSPRIPQFEVEGMMERGELFAARHDETGEILGVIQTEVKGEGVHAGLPEPELEPAQAGADINNGTASTGSGGCSDGTAADEQQQHDHGNKSRASTAPIAPAPKIGEFSMLAVKAHDESCGDVGGSGKGVGKLLVQAAEAHCRAHGCTLMQLGILCPDVNVEDEPEYKQWLQRWYLQLGYEHRETIKLQFRPDEVSEMYSYLAQLNPCKYILFDKAI